MKQGLLFTLQQNLYPPSFASNFAQNPLLEKLTQHIGMEGQILLSDLDEDDPFTQQVRAAFQEGLQKMIEQARAVLIRAKVQSQPELEAKRKFLNEVKGQALNFYLKHGGREIKHKIDTAMAQAYGILTIENRIILNNYWEMTLQDAWAGENHAQLEARLYKLFESRAKEALEEFTNREPPFTFPYGRTLKTALLEGFEGLAEEYAAARRTMRDEGVLIQFDYQMLKGQLIFRPILRRILRAVLSPLISKTPEKILILAGRKQQETRILIQQHQQDLDSPTCCVDLEVLKKAWGPLATEGTGSSIDYLLTFNTQSRERCLKVLENLKAYTAEECLKWAHRQWGFNPEELKNILAEETSYDRTAAKYLALLAPDEDDDELSLDLTSLEDPIAYFADRLKKRDEQALALFDEPLLLKSS